MDPAFHPQHLDQLITDFATRLPGVTRVLVVSSDGVPVAASGQPPPDQPDKLSAITSGLVGLARGAAGVADGGAFAQALVVMERGTLVVMAIDDESSLAVLATAAADLDQVGFEMTILADQAVGLVTAPVRSAIGDAGALEGQAAGLPGPLPIRVPFAR